VAPADDEWDLGKPGASWGAPMVPNVPSEPETEPEPETETEPEPEPEPVLEMESDPEPDPVLETEPEPELDPVLETEPEDPVAGEPAPPPVEDQPPPPPPAGRPSLFSRPAPPAPPGGWIPIALPPARGAPGVPPRDPLLPPGQPAPFDQDDGVEAPAASLDDLPPPPSDADQPPSPSVPPTPPTAAMPATPAPAPPPVDGPQPRPYASPLPEDVPPEVVPPSGRAGSARRRASSRGCAPVLIVMVVVAVIGVVAFAALGGSRDPGSSPSTTLDVSGLDELLGDTGGGPVERGGLPPGARLIGSRWSSAPGQVAMEITSPAGIQVAAATERGGTYEVGPWSPPLPGARTTAGAGHGDLLGTTDDGIVVLTTDGIALVDAASGRLRWATEVPRASATVVITSDALIVKTQEALIGIDPDNGARMWAVQVVDALLRSIDGHAVIARSGDNSQTEYLLLDSADGSVIRTSHPTCPEAPSTFSSNAPMTGVGGTDVVVMAGASDGSAGCVFRMDLQTGEVRWRSALVGVDASAIDRPVVGEGWLAVPSLDGSVLVLDVEDGSPRRLGEADGNRRVPLAGSGGSVIVVAGADDAEHDQVEVWDRGAGTRRWARSFPDGVPYGGGALGPRATPAATGSVSWSPTEVFLFGAYQEDAQLVQRVDLQTGKAVGDPVDLVALGGSFEDQDLDDPRDGQILSALSGLQVIDPAGDDPVQVLVP